MWERKAKTMKRGMRSDLFLFTLAILSVVSPVLSDLILPKVERRVSLCLCLHSQRHPDLALFLDMPSDSRNYSLNLPFCCWYERM